MVAVGYSNGANIAGAILLLQPGILAGAALLRPMVPIVPPDLPSLTGVPKLIAAGIEDPDRARGKTREGWRNCCGGPEPPWSHISSMRATA